jgi:uncharacterized tellurite resistance protein B-like protein
MSDTIRTSRLDGRELVVETKHGTRIYDHRFLAAALLIFVSRGSGTIEPEESAAMIELIRQHFKLEGAESLDLLTRAITEIAEDPELGGELVKLGHTLAEREKEDIAVMALKVIAADGKREFGEMQQFNTALKAIGATPETIHRAFDRYFAETMPDT